jgi:FkbM family methyltransferase
MFPSVFRWLRRRFGSEPVEPRLRLSAGHAPLTHAASESVVDAGSLSAQAAALPDPPDPGLLDRCRTQWQFGDWASLAALTQQEVAAHPDKAKLAVLAAAGHQQMGDMQAAKAWASSAREWGCDRKLLARILVGGVYNTLAKASSAAGQEARALGHFQQAVKGAGGDERLLLQVRSVREVARLGLLTDAAQRIKQQLAGLKDPGLTKSLSMGDPRLTVLKTQIELIQHEIQLAQQRAVAGRSGPSPAVGLAHDADTAQPVDAQGLDLPALRAQSTSQLGQDLWVLERTGYKRGGFFVEFGATDGVRLSNTFLLESVFGWRGICAEPNPGMFEKLRLNRRCQVTQACVGALTGERVEFVFADEYGGMVRNMGDDMHADKRAAFAAMPEFRAELETISLHDLLTSLNAPREIDYISIDTEGSELAILEAFPFERWRIKCLSVEHNFVAHTREAICALLSAHGYQRTEAKWDDWYCLED